MSELVDIFAAIAKVKAVGREPDTLIIHPRIYRKMTAVRTMGNSHQRRKARRHKARVRAFLESAQLHMEAIPE